MPSSDISKGRQRLTQKNWVEAIVHFRNPLEWDNKKRMALQFIKPTIGKLWSDGAILFFHYFFEPELHLRLYSEKDNLEEMKAIITKNVEPLEKELLHPIKFNSYNGESESFFRNTGRKDAWALGRSFFMENSGTALHFLEMFDRKDIFNPLNWMFDRFLHSFYNELGFSNEEEGKMLFEYSIHRATVETRNKKDRQGTEEILRHLKTKLQSLTKELLSQNLP